MKVAIIGAGFTGLAAAYELSKRGIDVTVFEKEKVPGGLAIGFKEKNWDWPLEKHYHHIFVSDKAIRNLAHKIGHKINFSNTATSTFIDGTIYQLDSPLTLIFFSKLPFIDRIWTGLILLYLKITPFWKPLEKTTAEKYLRNTMGDKSWDILWRPLFIKKFGSYANKIPASWFWARIKKRSVYLGYPEGGFQSLAENIEKKAKEFTAKFFYSTPVKSLEKTQRVFKVMTVGGKEFLFDKVICTLPMPLFLKITKGLPESYKKRYSKLTGLGAVNLVLSLKEKLLPDSVYWLNINDTNFPFLAVVEHTNFQSEKFYAGEKIVYLSNYLSPDHPYFQKGAEELLSEFIPYLKRINPGFDRSWVKNAKVFKTNFAQPVVTLNYSKIMPRLKTPIKGLFLANIQQVYPWDRGTNYAVELGEKAVKYAGKKTFF